MGYRGKGLLSAAGALDVTLAPEDERAADALVPPGWRTGRGLTDPNYSVRVRPTVVG
jgi:hypothetical protein